MVEKDNEAYIVDALARYMHQPVVLTNTTAPVPPYPYTSYTILNPVIATGGTYCFSHGVYYQPMTQVWSFTTHTDDPIASPRFGMRLYDFFARAGREGLYHHHIVVADVGSVTSRDNLLTLQFEYRTGADVTFRMMHRLDVCEGDITSEDVRVKEDHRLKSQEFIRKGMK